MSTTMSTALSVAAPGRSGHRVGAPPTREATTEHIGTHDVLEMHEPSAPAMSPGLATFLAKGPGYWTDVEGAEDYPATRPEVPARRPETAGPEVHENRTGTFTVLEPPPSEGLRTLLAKSPDYWTSPG